jgi:RNA polymerase sigma factor (sigma-70 family)
MPASGTHNVQLMVDHLFRHEAGKMVAVLSRAFGFSNIETAEDIVQDTLLKALETWKYDAIPANPQAWLYRVAKNKAIDVIRRQQLKYKIDTDLTALLQSEYSLVPAINELFEESEINDSLLRMMFACCHPAIGHESQISLILKTLCGLSAREIASAFLSQEDTITKRLYRTKEKIRKEHISLEYPGAAHMPSRIHAILTTLYLLFNEGYHSSHPEKLIREDLCEEAMRLLLLLCNNPRTGLPEAQALMALMCYQVSRFNSRLDDKGYIVLLQDQDRSQWNNYLIEKGNEFMARASAGHQIHKYHIEAGIAWAHANAANYQETDWQLILHLYDSLLSSHYNPIVALNRSVVLGEVAGYQAAINELLQLTTLHSSSYYHTTLGEMNLKAGYKEQALLCFQSALLLTTSQPERELIQRKINMCQ